MPSFIKRLANSIQSGSGPRGRALGFGPGQTSLKEANPTCSAERSGIRLLLVCGLKFRNLVLLADSKRKSIAKVDAESIHLQFDFGCEQKNLRWLRRTGSSFRSCLGITRIVRSSVFSGTLELRKRQTMSHRFFVFRIQFLPPWKPQSVPKITAGGPR